VLMPIAIAINIVLGQTVAAVLKVPIYMDSIGTVLVGVLAGPIPGLVTGLASNLIWQYVLPAPFHSDFAGPFAVVAAWIGFFSGVVAQVGGFRSRPGSSGRQLIGAALIALLILGGLAFYTVTRYYTGAFEFFNPEADLGPLFQILGIAVALIVIGAVVGFLALLFLRRDAGVAYVVAGGAVCGVVSALISAPIAAYVFGGVTGSGTDLLVAAFQRAGSDLITAVTQQGLLSDPIDKTITFFVVFVLLRTLSRRYVARFPQGEKAVGLEGA
ncbi:MAG TPA: hypothetical protein VK867_10525, partial [Candidatus Limnocylindrales bacterium]|nr:hypothetical protein [Candidatus Limnocylindrales bacterium]